MKKYRFDPGKIMCKHRLSQGQPALLRSFSLLVLLAVLVCGCSNKGDEAPAAGASSPYTNPLYDWRRNGNETLTLWAQEPDMDRVYMKRALENYEACTGNKVDVVQFPKEEFQSRVAEAFDNDAGNPDLILSYGGANMDLFQPDENLYDFTDAVWVDDLTDTSINQTIYHGKVIGLPHWEASISGTLYNKQIFEDLHIDIPKSQSEFMKVCRKLLTAGITPVYMPFKDTSMMLYQFPLDSVVQDSNTLDALNENQLSYSDIPEMKQIVNWYKDMADKGFLGEHFESNTWDGMSAALKSEKYAMMLCWDTWLYTDFDGDPSKFGIMPAFMGVPDSGTFEGPNLALMTVNRHSHHLDASVDFVTFLADPYNYNKAFESIYTAPVFKRQTASVSTPQYTEAERLIERNYHDSTAWLRIRGFSQMDANCIKDYITSGGAIDDHDCLKNMDDLRRQRMAD